MTNILSYTDGGLLTRDNCALAFIDLQPRPDLRPVMEQ